MESNKIVMFAGSQGGHFVELMGLKSLFAKYNSVLVTDNLSATYDNKDLFDFAVEELEPAGWKAEVITYDLHKDAKLVEGNIMTEYEEKFSSKGNPICKYVIYR